MFGWLYVPSSDDNLRAYGPLPSGCATCVADPQSDWPLFQQGQANLARVVLPPRPRCWRIRSGACLSTRGGQYSFDHRGNRVLRHRTLPRALDRGPYCSGPTTWPQVHL
jgi:hypothetical protein